MYLKQFVRDESGCAAYLVGSSHDGCAAVIDPQWNVAPYLEAAAAKGLRITHVFETHLHADHLSGGRRLAELTGAEIALHAAAEALYPHRALADGDTIRLGEVELRVLHTPGHRPENITLLVADLDRASEPWAALTGDALFVGGVGRPDLGGEAAAYASALYDSLDRLLKLPDWVEIYPSHVGGSACGAGLSGATSSTIGFERRYNYATQPRSREQFVALVTGELPPQPANFEAIVARNRGALPVTEPKLPPLSVSAVRERLNAGAEVLDCREPRAYGEGHIQGAVNVPLRAGGFGVRAGWVFTAETPLVLVLERDEDAADALNALASIGFGGMQGYMEGGLDAWRAAGAPLVALPQVTVHELREALADGEAPFVVDVREEGEYGGGHVREALNVPFWAVPGRLAEIPADRAVAVVCEGGLRSSLGASLLERAGYRNLQNVVGGMSAWRQAGYQTA